MKFTKPCHNTNKLELVRYMAVYCYLNVDKNKTHAKS